MSQENVEIVRRSIEAFRRDDIPGALSYLDPQIEFDASRTNPEGRVYHGHQGVIEAVTQWTDTWDEYEIEPVEFFSAPGGLVVVKLRERGRIKGSDTWTEHQRGAVYTVRDGTIVRYEEHFDLAAALEAAGLSE
jgi:ketosteroid isomerase-like protein